MMKNFKKGYSLIEIMVAVAILTLILGIWGAFQADIFSINDFIQKGLNEQFEAKKIIRPFAGEVRSAIPSDLGAYPIEMAGTSTFVFYSNIDGDNKIERVRYFLDGETHTFKKGIIKPSENPVAYNLSDEQIIQVVHDVSNQPVFDYFDSSYDGTSSTSPLNFPIDINKIRLIKLSLKVNDLIYQTQVSIRNLKDNR